MTAHEDVGKILFNQLTVESTPVLNMVNRYSGKSGEEEKKRGNHSYETCMNPKLPTKCLARGRKY